MLTSPPADRAEFLLCGAGVKCWQMSRNSASVSPFGPAAGVRTGAQRAAPRALASRARLQRRDVSGASERCLPRVQRSGTVLLREANPGVASRARKASARGAARCGRRSEHPAAGPNGDTDGAVARHCNILTPAPHKRNSAAVCWRRKSTLWANCPIRGKGRHCGGMAKPRFADDDAPQEFSARHDATPVMHAYLNRVATLQTLRKWMRGL